MLNIALIDTIGLTYDGNTLSKRGLGGSESAIILMAKELAKLGHNVTVYNNCTDSEASEGIYDDVEYVDIESLYSITDNGPLGAIDPTAYHQDIVISSRSVYPFIDDKFRWLFSEKTYRVLWMHDTFCKGDEHIEGLVVNGKIDTIFTLSDFHTSYTTNCDHGHKRMFEVLKKHIFMTRNGIVRYKDADVQDKDPDLFVYNASVTKGMIPLVTEIWPEVKKLIPSARLKVIGGYYRFRENAEPDEQEKIWREMVATPAYSRLDIDFTGIIKQSEIAEILSKASFMIYPAAFPETFGISTLESLAYNTPLITCRFGALEETAIESACYLIDYPIEPNGLFPHIDKNKQRSSFVSQVFQAHRDRYLHQQKMYACNIVKDICGWDTIALQWEQHFYKKLGMYLPKEKYRKVSEINSRVHEVFGRRFMNAEENVVPRNKEKNILVVTPMYNAGVYIEKCIQSVITQDYDHLFMVIIDDASDNKKGINVVKSFREEDRILLVENDTNKGALANQVDAILDFYSEYNDIVVLLDGDDSLVNDNQIFHRINNIYQNRDIKMTYGSCWSMADNIPLIAQPYPSKVFRDRSFRDYQFSWGIPYTHLRTFEMRYLTNNVIEKCKDDNGEFYKAGGDSALFYALIEEMEEKNVKVVQDILVNYNDINPLNDYKVNSEEQTRNANKIKKMKEKSEVNKLKSILIAVPTNKYVETATMKSIYDLEIPNGCRTELQFFYGYQIDQVRNLIAEWGKNYDYLFCVDSDIVVPRDALTRMVFQQKDVISGAYVQRMHGGIPEVYDKNYIRMDIHDLMGDKTIEVGACGFGCVLIDSKVLHKMEYPHFVYKSAIDHAETFSEDIYFCQKARGLGYTIWCDTSIWCDHIGQTVYSKPVLTVGGVKPKNTPTVEENIKYVAEQDLLPACHVDYLYNLRAQSLYPKVIYDIGACVGHWGRHAKECWKDAKIYAFEANGQLFGSLYDSKIYDQNYTVVLSYKDGMEVDFYHNPYNLGGNSYYKELTGEFNETHIEKRTTFTLDGVVYDSLIAFPDLIKIDVQGAELDVLEGAQKCIETCRDIIVECQHVEYNEGAPKFEAVKNFLERRGFKLVSNFCRTEVDGDYHFTKI